jgi:molecular chaperone DnaK (HSP70)
LSFSDLPQFYVVYDSFIYAAPHCHAVTYISQEGDEAVSETPAEEKKMEVKNETVFRAEQVACESCGDLGARHFAEAIFKLLQGECEAKHKFKVEAKTKGGQRLMNGCMAILKLLSTSLLANTTVENLHPDGIDINFNVKLNDFENAAAPIVRRLKEMFRKALADAGISGGESVEVVEIVGGGCRIPMVKKCMQDLFGGEGKLGFTLDSTCGATKGAVVAAKTHLLHQIELLLSAKVLLSEH